MTVYTLWIFISCVQIQSGCKPLPSTPIFKPVSTYDTVPACDAAQQETMKAIKAAGLGGITMCLPGRPAASSVP